MRWDLDNGHQISLVIAAWTRHYVSDKKVGRMLAATANMKINIMNNAIVVMTQ